MDFFNDVWNVLTNSGNLEQWIGQHGSHIYLWLALIIFCETGLVVLPFLPGDSLLFGAGTLAAGHGEKLSLAVLWILLPVAAILGDNLNYWIGRSLGPKVFSRPRSKIFNPRMLAKTQAFYVKHGRKTILMARFIPLMRTFAPFVAGVGHMDYVRFLLYSIAGAFIWVIVCTSAGFLLGNIPIVKENFDLIVAGIVIVSILMPILGWWKARREGM
jgi:membrane-associated protein